MAFSEQESVKPVGGGKRTDGEVRDRGPEESPGKDMHACIFLPNQSDVDSVSNWCLPAFRSTRIARGFRSRHTHTHQRRGEMTITIAAIPSRVTTQRGNEGY